MQDIEGRFFDEAPAAALALGVAAAGTAAIGGATTLLPAGALALAWLSCLVGAAILFSPAGGRGRGSWLIWAPALAIAGGAGVAVLASPARGIAAAAVLLPMILILQAVIALGVPRLALFTLAAGLFAAPVWLGPLGELAGSQSGIPLWIALASPLSHLAAVAGCDYLHADWFYERSALAGLGAGTPSATAVIVGYVAVAAGIFGFNLARSRTAAQAATTSLTRLTRLQESRWSGTDGCWARRSR